MGPVATPDLVPLIIFVTMTLLAVGVWQYIAHQVAEDAKRKMNAVCPPHNWKYDSTNRMFCDICGLPPGHRSHF